MTETRLPIEVDYQRTICPSGYAGPVLFSLQFSMCRHIKEDDAGVVRLTVYGDDHGFVEAGLMQAHDALSGMVEGICEVFRVAEPDRARVDATFAAAKRRVTAGESRTASDT